MLIGYVRVSTGEQSLHRQEKALIERGVEKIYSDVISGACWDRPGLCSMMNFVREGDTVMVESISRFARNTRDLLELTERLAALGADFVSLSEAIDTQSPTGKFMLTVFAAVSELERDYMLQRQREGIEQARLAGKYRGRAPIEIDDVHWDSVIASWRAGNITAVRAQKLLGISASTFYRRLKQKA